MILLPAAGILFVVPCVAHWCFWAFNSALFIDSPLPACRQAGFVGSLYEKDCTRSSEGMLRAFISLPTI